MIDIKECVVVDIHGRQIFNEGKAIMSFEEKIDSFKISRYINDLEVINIFPKHNISNFHYVPVIRKEQMS